MFKENLCWDVLILILQEMILSFYLSYSHDYSCLYLNADFMLTFKKNLKQQEKLQNMYQVNHSQKDGYLQDFSVYKKRFKFRKN